jgi:hypothetical protein
VTPDLRHRLHRELDRLLRSAGAKLAEFGPDAPRRLSAEERLALVVASGCATRVVRRGRTLRVLPVWQIDIRVELGKYVVSEFGDAEPSFEAPWETLTMNALTSHLEQLVLLQYTLHRAPIAVQMGDKLWAHLIARELLPREWLGAHPAGVPALRGLPVFLCACGECECNRWIDLVTMRHLPENLGVQIVTVRTPLSQEALQNYGLHAAMRGEVAPPKGGFAGFDALSLIPELPPAIAPTTFQSETPAATPKPTPPGRARPYLN